jgi:hypothetical protein
MNDSSFTHVRTSVYTPARMKLLVTACLLAAASPCLADSLQPWIGASGSYNTYAMGEINDEIAAFNETLQPLHMDEIDSGIGFGLSLGADVDRWSFSIGYDRLPASTEINGPSGGSTYDLAANAFVGRAAYRLPFNAKFGISLGLGAGIASASGNIGQYVSAAAVGPSINADIYEGGAEVSGSTFCYEGFAVGDVPLGGKLSLVPSIGYRVAKIDGKMSDSVTSSDKTFDFSGMAAQVGLRFAL